MDFHLVSSNLKAEKRNTEYECVEKFKPTIQHMMDMSIVYNINVMFYVLRFDN